MDNRRIIPDDPLKFIKKCIKEKKVFWTYHVNMRLEKRSVTREMIFSSIDQMEIIEKYPDDRYFPSYLLLFRYDGIYYHVLIAMDVAGDNVRVVTAYLPNTNKWEPNFKTRRKTDDLP
jgi:hypothetical protein